MVQSPTVLQPCMVAHMVEDSLWETKEDSLQLPHSGIRAKYSADCNGGDSRPVFMALGNPFHDLQKKAVFAIFFLLPNTNRIRMATSRGGQARSLGH